jgi:HCOMODA/2-hydroxy-3-carboxy-muconic semialdehyde decarboxylase
MKLPLLAAAAALAAAAPLSSQTPAAPTRQAVIGELVVANRILANEGVLDGYGHVSVRSPATGSLFPARAGRRLL